jgi:hypothetical protein
VTTAPMTAPRFTAEDYLRLIDRVRQTGPNELRIALAQAAQTERAYQRLREAAENLLAYKPIDQRLDHTGAMNATQLGERDGWLVVRDALRAALKETP